MIPMSAWTLTVFSILGISFSRDHQKESARALKMVRQTLTRERFGATTAAVFLTKDSSLITGIGSSARPLVSVGGK